MNNEWKAEVKLTVKDIFIFLLRHSFSTWQGKVTWLLGVLALIGAPVIMLYGKDNFSAFVFLVVAFIYLVISPLSLYSNAKRQMISNSVFKNRIVFRFRDDLIHVTQYTGEVELFWHQIEKIDITAKYFYLYVNDKQAFIVPKDSFASGSLEGVATLMEKKKAFRKAPKVSRRSERKNKSKIVVSEVKSILTPEAKRELDLKLEQEKNEKQVKKTKSNKKNKKK